MSWSERLLKVISGQVVLGVASTGGHLAQLERWATILEFSRSSTIVTFQSPQAKRLERSWNLKYVDYLKPRDGVGAVRALRQLRPILNDANPDVVLSTGAAIALPAAISARAKAVPFVYLESVSRFDGPSLTGKLLRFVPGVDRYCQHPGYGAGWREVDSLLGLYAVAERPSLGKDRPLRVFVTLGTIRPYGFDRLIATVLSFVTDSDEIIWQLGESSPSLDLVGESVAYMTSEAFDAAVRWADIVVTHAGVGSLLAILEGGRLPLVMARSAAFGEHVDDHQSQVLMRLCSLGLAIDLASVASREAFLRASNYEVRV